MEILVYFIFIFILLYIIIGLIFYCFFIFKGLVKVDKDASGTSIFFKLFILPGTLLFWPVLMNKWLKIK